MKYYDTFLSDLMEKTISFKVLINSLLLRAFLLFILVLGKNCFLSAQENKLNLTEQKIDSLIKEVRKVSRKHDSLKIVGGQLLQFGKSRNSPRAIFEGYFALGFSNYGAGNYAASINYYDSALNLQNKDYKGYFNAYTRTLRNRGIAYRRMGQTEKAIKEFENLLSLGEKMNDRPIEAFASNELGITLMNKGDYGQSIIFYTKALHIFDSLKRFRNKHLIVMNLGIAHNQLGQKVQSLKYFKYAVEIAKKHQINRGYYRSISNLSVAYMTVGKYDSSLLYLKESIAYYKTINHKLRLNIAYENVAHTLAKKGELDSATILLKKVVNSFQSLGAKKSLVEAYHVMAEVKTSKKQYDSAIYYFEESLLIAREIDLDASFDEIYKSLAELYELKGDYKSANKFLTYSNEIKDSIFSAEGLKTLNEILTKYEVDKKNDQISTLSQYKSLIAPISTGLGFITLLAGFIFYRYRKSKERLQITQEENEKIIGEVQKHKKEVIELKSKAIIPLEELISIASEGHYLEFHLMSKEKPEVDRNRLKEIKDRLPSNFIQIHKSFIVNISFIKVKYADKVLLKDGRELPVSRTYKEQLNRAVGRDIG